MLDFQVKGVILQYSLRLDAIIKFKGERIKHVIRVAGVIEYGVLIVKGF